MSRKALFNTASAGLLVSFVGGVYYWTTARVRATDLFSSVGSELDEARAIKAGSRSDGGGAGGSSSSGSGGGSSSGSGSAAPAKK